MFRNLICTIFTARVIARDLKNSAINLSPPPECTSKKSEISFINMNTNDVYHMINHIIPGAVLRPNEIRISFFTFVSFSSIHVRS